MAHSNKSWPVFFAVSLAVHLLFLIALPKIPVKKPTRDVISVSFIPAREPVRAPAPAPALRRPAPTKPSRAKAIIAKKNTPILRDLPEIPKETIVPKETQPKDTRIEEVPKRQPARESIVTAERRLPSLKELLPPITWSPDAQRSSHGDAPVRLNTRDPQYITYFGSIKRAIEVVWQYPELALQYGLQGKLLLEFSVLGNGELSGTKIIRSSGSSLLDEEALRAVNQAAPFSPIPPWIGKNRIDILASFEYHDNRLNYRVLP